MLLSMQLIDTKGTEHYDIVDVLAQSSRSGMAKRVFFSIWSH